MDCIGYSGLVLPGGYASCRHLSLPGLGSLAPNLRLSKSEGIGVTVTPRGLSPDGI